MIKTTNKFHSLLILLFWCLLSLKSFGAEEHFPVPDSIRPAINFWIKVYTEADTESGFLHDANNLSVVYVKLPRDRASINTHRERIQDDLRVLASGKREGLTASQQGILALWPQDVSNERLARAANAVRWQLGQSDRFIAGLQRSGAYRDHIERVVAAKDMPRELASLPHVESSFHPGAYSSAAATGMWQFIRSTAQRFMRVDYVVDDRLDPYTATHGAMALLEYNYKVLGTWPLALTAYNHGANGMARAVRETGSRDIGRIISDYRGPRFGFASRNFYPQFLAALEVERRAGEFFGPVELHKHPGFYEQEMESFVDASVLARSLGVSIAELQRDNPALQPSVWSGTKRIPKGYTIRVRRDALPSADLVASLDSVPINALYSEQIPDLSYEVRRGDSLSLIADRYNTSISELVAINQLRDRHTIRIGQTLLLPQEDGSVPTLLVNSDDDRTMPSDGVYQVRRGDTLSRIADRFGVPEETLQAFNSLDNSDLIFPGQSLRLQPSGDEAPANRLASVDEAPADAVADVEEGVAETPSALGTDARELADAGDSAQTRGEALATEARSEDNEALEVDLSTDPADYSVALDETIEIQAIETLGHYAEWLDIRAWDLRRLNGMNYGEPVIIGERLKLDFSEVDKQTFENRRLAFHRDIQQQYFANWRIEETEEYSIQRRDYLDSLTRERSVPMWLFRQYNPDVDFERLQVGQVIVFPVVERVL